MARRHERSRHTIKVNVWGKRKQRVNYRVPARFGEVCAQDYLDAVRTFMIRFGLGEMDFVGSAHREGYWFFVQCDKEANPMSTDGSLALRQN